MSAGKLDDISAALKAAYPKTWIDSLANTTGRRFWEAHVPTDITPMEVAQAVTSLMLFSLPAGPDREKAAGAIIPVLLKLVSMAMKVKEEEAAEEDASQSALIQSIKHLTQQIPGQGRGRKANQLVMSQAQYEAYMKMVVGNTMGKITQIYNPGDKPVRAQIAGMPVVIDPEQDTGGMKFEYKWTTVKKTW
jgi:hypothetical protein